jgi:hypothetical protein
MLWEAVALHRGTVGLAEHGYTLEASFGVQAVQAVVAPAASLNCSSWMCGSPHAGACSRGRCMHVTARCSEITIAPAVSILVLSSKLASSIFLSANRAVLRFFFPLRHQS